MHGDVVAETLVDDPVQLPGPQSKYPHLLVRGERREELSAGGDGEVERPRLVLCELEEVGVQLRLEGHVGRGLAVASPVLDQATLVVYEIRVAKVVRNSRMKYYVLVNI